MSGKLTLQGGKSLKGTVEVLGAKNAVSKQMVAAILTDQKCQLNRVGEVDDIAIVSDLIRTFGGQVSELKNNSISIEARNLKIVKQEVLRPFLKKSRIPILFCGPLLHRLGEAIIPNLGGCEIGPRPVDFHLKALELMGAKIEENPLFYFLSAPDGLTGAKIRLDYPSVGATEQVLLSAVTAKGLTELSNAAVEPEIIDLVLLLQKMGAKISIDSDRTYLIRGVENLNGYTHTPIPDRMEAASWACAALATDGKILVKNARQEHLLRFLDSFREAGGGFDITDQGITFFQAKELAPVSIETDVHPGFMTDWLQPFVVVLTQANGPSVIHETVYENRFGFTSELIKMGASIRIENRCLGSKACRFGQMNHLHSAIITGPTKLKGIVAEIPDLRAGFSMVIAALMADGVSTLENINLINRGYANFFDKLKAVGANILEIKD